MNVRFASLLCLASSIAYGIAPARGAGEAPTATSTLVLRLRGPADAAFALFDPVGEARWDAEWHPRFVGPANVAQGLVFETTGDAGARTVWILDRYDPVHRTLRYVNVAGGRTLTQLDITVTPRGSAASEATLRRSQTALEPAAFAAVRAHARAVATQAPQWERALNAALLSPTRHG